MDRAAVAGDMEVGRVVAGRHGVSEGQRIAAAAAFVVRRAAIAERKRRRAGDGDRLGGVERDGDDMADADVGSTVVGHCR